MPSELDIDVECTYTSFGYTIWKHVQVMDFAQLIALKYTFQFQI